MGDSGEAQWGTQAGRVNLSLGQRGLGTGLSTLRQTPTVHHQAWLVHRRQDCPPWGKLPLPADPRCRGKAPSRETKFEEHGVPVPTPEALSTALSTPVLCYLPQPIPTQEAGMGKGGSIHMFGRTPSLPHPGCPRSSSALPSAQPLGNAGPLTWYALGTPHSAWKH